MCLAAWRRARVQRQPFPHAWRDILRHRMPAFARLPPHLQLQVKKHVQVVVPKAVPVATLPVQKVVKHKSHTTTKSSG